MTPDDFTLDGYAALLDALLARGYQARGFADAEPARRDLIVRHDLDVSIPAALLLARIEAARGVAAHYFVLLRTELYNPFAAAGVGDLQRLGELGHTVGLHFDAALYPDDLDALDRAVRREAGMLADLLGKPVDMVSLHRPAHALQGLDRRLGGCRHAYEPRFFREMGYCSDSRGGWHHGHPLDHAAVRDGRTLQLLTHPIWWVRDRDDGPVAALDRVRAERDALFAAELAANCEPYRRRLESVEMPESVEMAARGRGDGRGR